MKYIFQAQTAPVDFELRDVFIFMAREKRLRPQQVNSVELFVISTSDQDLVVRAKIMFCTSTENLIKISASVTDGREYSLDDMTEKKMFVINKKSC